MGVEWRLEQYVAQLETAIFSATKSYEGGTDLVAYLIAKELELYQGPLTFCADSIEVSILVKECKSSLHCVFKKEAHACNIECRGLQLYLSTNLLKVVKNGDSDD